MGTEKACAMAQGSHVLGSSKEKAYSATSLEAKTEVDDFYGSDSEWLRKRDYHSTDQELGADILDGPGPSADWSCSTACSDTATGPTDSTPSGLSAATSDSTSTTGVAVREVEKQTVALALHCAFR